MWHPYSRKQSGCLALRTNGTTPLKRPRRRRGPRPPAPAPAPSRGARRRPSARRRTARPARGGRARREPEAKSQRPPCVASCRTRSAAAQAGGAARGARDHIKVASGLHVPPRPRFSSSASRTRRRPCAIYDGRFGTAGRAEASDRVAEEAAGPLRVAHPRRGPSSFARRDGDALHSRGSEASRRRRRRRSISGLPIYGRRSVEAGPPHD